MGEICFIYILHHLPLQSFHSTTPLTSPIHQKANVGKSSTLSSAPAMNTTKTCTPVRAPPPCTNHSTERRKERKKGNPKTPTWPSSCNSKQLKSLYCFGRVYCLLLFSRIGCEYQFSFYAHPSYCSHRNGNPNQHKHLHSSRTHL